MIPLPVEMSYWCCPVAPLFSTLQPMRWLRALPADSVERSQRAEQRPQNQQTLNTLKSFSEEKILDEAGRARKWSSVLSAAEEGSQGSQGSPDGLKAPEALDALVVLCKEKPSLFKELVVSGVPSELRWEVWKAALGGLRSFGGAEGRYQELLCERSSWESLIEQDSKRTFLVLPLEGANKGHSRSLQNICKAYANLSPEVGYCQGMNFIVGLLLLVSGGAEEETFWVFVALMHDLQLSGFYTGGFPLLRRYMDGFGQLLVAVLPRISRHLQDEGIHVEEFLQSWYLTLFVTCLPKAAVVEIWDEIICCSGLPLLVPLSVALLECIPVSSSQRKFKFLLKDVVASKAIAIAQFLRRRWKVS